eukprot:GHVH01010477.1.p1 GENE.GHVH01010477.1~~GHVH01010477.1.p1  ORF type:complete len:441 (+),score=53.68 GHVH01010477.1:311-1633(+)
MNLGGGAYIGVAPYKQFCNDEWLRSINDLLPSRCRVIPGRSEVSKNFSFYSNSTSLRTRALTSVGPLKNQCANSRPAPPGLRPVVPLSSDPREGKVALPRRVRSPKLEGGCEKLSSSSEGATLRLPASLAPSQCEPSDLLKGSWPHSFVEVEDTLRCLIGCESNGAPKDPTVLVNDPTVGANQSFINAPWSSAAPKNSVTPRLSMLNTILCDQARTPNLDPFAGSSKAQPAANRANDPSAAAPSPLQLLNGSEEGEAMSGPVARGDDDDKKCKSRTKNPSARGDELVGRSVFFRSALIPYGGRPPPSSTLATPSGEMSSSHRTGIANKIKKFFIVGTSLHYIAIREYLRSGTKGVELDTTLYVTKKENVRLAQGRPTKRYEAIDMEHVVVSATHLDYNMREVGPGKERGSDNREFGSPQRWSNEWEYGGNDGPNDGLLNQ